MIKKILAAALFTVVLTANVLAQNAPNFGSIMVPNTAIPTGLPPSGAAGGSLKGTYPNPGLADVNSIATSLAIGGCTISTNAFCITGNSAVSGSVTAGSFIPTSSSVPTNGIYLSGASQVGLAAGSASRFFYNSSGILGGVNGAASALINLASSSTVPTLVPNRADTTTGIGAQAAGNVSIVVGGAENTRFAAALVTHNTEVDALSFVPTGSTVPTNGMYLSSANSLGFSTNGGNRWNISAAGTLFNAFATGVALAPSAASSTNPTLIPNRTDTTTGIGAQAAGNVSIVVGGAENTRFAAALVTHNTEVDALSFVPTGSTVPTNGMYLSAANNVSIATNSGVRATFSTATMTSFVNIAGSNANGYQLVAQAASSTLPTYAPNKADITTGIGAQAAGNISLIAVGTEVARVTQFATTALLPFNASYSAVASSSAVLANGTLFTGGTGTTNFPQILIQPTGTTAATTWSTSGTILGANVVSGFTGNFLDFRIAGGNSLFSISQFGTVTSAGSLLANAASTVGWNGRASLTSPATATFQLGSADAAAPVAQTLRAQSVVAGTSNTAGADWTIAGSVGTGTGAGGSIIFQTAPFGSTGSAQNALVTALTILPSGTVTGVGSVLAGNAGTLGFVNRSRLSSTVDGILALTNTAGTDFTRLQFGGTTSSFPALARSTTGLQAVLADNSADTTVQASAFLPSGSATPVNGMNLSGANTLGFATSSAIRFQIGTASITGTLPMRALSGTAIPAGGTAGSGFLFSSTANFGVFFGSGAPTLTAAKGSLYLRSDGSTTNDRAYIATDSAGTWTALTTAL